MNISEKALYDSLATQKTISNKLLSLKRVNEYSQSKRSERAIEKRIEKIKQLRRETLAVA